MNGWFRKEDWWIPVISAIFLFFYFMFWCVSNDSVDTKRLDCELKGGSYLYLKYSGHKCLKEIK